ncbi:surF1 family protein [Asticcacaulis biprosthecium C19]|uniref:SURF1-like protein n=1 Tax=Asticcacaulis biprosthecium C19 TaxID=715226 RepID=F4QSZ7_9CAUL|nr:SURF1 family cytochrome oxidase biogenesis protein [Asticcacaulis biprosthecium]EGF89867.1 surF1 family protein [Asticcacaulis biprosthecium C19]
MSLSRFLTAVPKGLSIAVAIAFVILNVLGVWQAQRLVWKRNLVAELASTQAQAPQPLAAILASPKPAWRAVTLTRCDVSPDRVLHMHGLSDGKPGYRLLAPCPAGDRTILVELGFAEDKLQPSFSIEHPVGRLRAFDKSGVFTPMNDPIRNDWYWRSPLDMGAFLRAPDLREDYFVMLDHAPSGVSVKNLQQSHLTAELSNRHFEYALTWFALAWTLLAVFGAFVFQRMRKS